MSSFQDLTLYVVKTVFTLLPGKSVEVSSPNYPENYDSNVRCEYVIRAKDNVTIVAHIDDFSLEENFDYVYLGDGINAGDNELARLTGEHRGTTVFSSGKCDVDDL